MTNCNWSRREVLSIGAATVALAAAPAAAEIITDIDASTLAKTKTTPLGLYLSPEAAHRALQANPEILFVDVRDPIEITFVGHPGGLDKIIPIRTATHEVITKSGQYKMVTNPRFFEDFAALFEAKGAEKDHPLFVTCRSGSRSAAAVRRLMDAGYTNVWNLTEGFEGDMNADGTRAVNGWRNAGLPWGYRLAEGVAWEGWPASQSHF